MRNLLLSLALAATANAQVQVGLPPGTDLPVGKVDWNIVCTPFIPYTYMTSADADRAIDPAYPGTTPRYAIKLGGTLMSRVIQRGIHCGTGVGIGVNNPAFFLFGPRTSNVFQLPNAFATSQNYLFNYSAALSINYAQYRGPWENNPNIEVFAWTVNVPNNVALAGTEWACQGMIWGGGVRRLGNSWYTRIIDPATVN